MPTILLNGATGYKGRRLKKGQLRHRQCCSLRLLVRPPRRLSITTRRHCDVIEGDILSSIPDAVRTIWIRAGVIIGSGSTSVEIIHHLVEKLPMMITPCRGRTLTQPIGMDDVLAYLNAAIDPDISGTLVVDHRTGNPHSTY